MVKLVWMSVGGTVVDNFSGDIFGICWIRMDDLKLTCDTYRKTW
jgi:hypothetical protein